MNEVRAGLLTGALALLGFFATPLSAQTAPPPAESGRVAPLVSLGSPAEDRARVEQLLGAPATDGFLLRSLSSRLPPLAPGERGVRWSLLAPELDLTWNRKLPFSLNDGAVWAGRGTSLLVTGGARLGLGPLSLVLAPQLAYSQNRDFLTFVESRGFGPSRPEGDSLSRFSSPFYVGDVSADLPLRFGDRPLLRLTPGQSTLMVTAGPVAAGASTENQWWGPGIRNAIVMSNQAEGVPHLFLRTARPVRTRLGSLEARWMVGGLTESLYFDTLTANDVRSLSGFAATFRPAAEPDLTLGVARVVYARARGAGAVPGHALDVFTRWERRPEQDAGSAAPPEPLAHQQILSLFWRWLLPRSGAEFYGEWARTERPASFADLLNAPNHTQGYTLGVQWARPVHEHDRVRLQGELTYLEEGATFNNRPGQWFYVSEGVPQGYTQRGQPLGAAVGPGGSGQWLAGDYLAREWSAGLFGGRIRWNDDVYYRKPGRIYGAHDVSLFGGVRGGLRAWRAYLNAELSSEHRYNYLFQNPETEPEGREAIDAHNTTLRLSVTPDFLRW